MRDDIRESELIGRCLTGEDPEAWDLFVSKYSGLIWNALHRTFSLYHFHYQQEDAEELFNSVFLSLLEDDFRRLRQFRSENNCSLSTWLSVVSGRMAIDFLRKDRSHCFVEPSPGAPEIWELLCDGADGIDRAIEKQELQQEVEEAVRGLTPRDRIICRLLFMYGQSAKEVADLLRMPENLVYSRKHRIIRQLKKSLTAV